MAFASAGVSPWDSAHGPTSQLRSSRVTDGMTNQVRVATMTALMTRVRNASGHGAIVGPRNVTAAAATGDRGSREVTPPLRRLSAAAGEEAEQRENHDDDDDPDDDAEDAPPLGTGFSAQPFQRCNPAGETQKEVSWRPAHSSRSCV
jgi:hypothetical protein